LRNEAKTAKVATQNSKIEDYQKKYPDVSLMSGTLDQYRVSYRLVDGDKAGLELDLTEYNLNNSFNKVVYELSYSRGSSDGNKSEILAAFEIDPFSLCRGYPESLPARAQLTSSVSKYFVPKIASKVGDVVMWKASAYVSRCSRHVQDCEEKVGPSEISKALQSHSAK
jgi:hypothetical protein